MAQAKVFNVALIGHSKTKKTTFVKNLLYSSNVNHPLPCTLGVNVTPFDFRTIDGGRYRLNIWDCAGNTNYMGLGDKYLKNSDLVIIFKHPDKNNNVFKKWVPKNTPYIWADMTPNNALSTILYNIKRALV